MSTPEQPAQGLTRKQLRELRMTGATPIVTVPSDEPEHEVDASPVDDAAAAAAAPVEDSAPAVPLARPAEPLSIPEPTADAHVDLGVSPLTRRQAREQERIRTASVPVITPELLAAHSAQQVAESTAASDEVELLEVVPDDALAHDAGQPDAESATDAPADPAEGEPEAAPALAEGFGSHLLAAPEPPAASLTDSFDDLITLDGSTAGSASAPNALILQSPDAPSLAGPITATGEVLITGSLPLEGLGSRGHAPGAHDGKEVDAVLIDGELPAHSSPTPIAASAAISTVKSAGEIIRPPAPERGSRLMLVLAITAGALALALVGVLIVAFATGSI